MSISHSSPFVLPLCLTRDGLKPVDWGPPLWYILFILCWYNETVYHGEKAYLPEFLALLDDLCVLMYCRACREWYCRFYHNYKKEHSFDTWSDVSDFLYQLKTANNLKLHKPNARGFVDDIIYREYVAPHNEDRLMYEGKGASRYFQECLWLILYCHALNYPPEISMWNTLLNDKDHMIATTTIDFLHNLSFLLDPTKSFTSLRTQLLQRQDIFHSRKEFVDYVYQLEISTNTSHKSRFGNTEQQVISYLEQHLRSKT
jgi:hypothetical protein